MAIFSGKFYLTEKTSEYDFVPPEFHGGSTLGRNFKFQFVWALDSGMTNVQTYKQTNQHYCFCPDFSTVRTHLLTQLGI